MRIQRIVFLIAIFVFAGNAYSQIRKDQIVILSPEIGRVIDSAENAENVFFPSFNNIKKIIIFRTLEKYHYAWITFSDSTKNDTLKWLPGPLLIELTNKALGKSIPEHYEWLTTESEYFPKSQLMRQQAEYLKLKDSAYGEFHFEELQKRADEPRWTITTYEYIYTELSLQWIIGDSLIVRDDLGSFPILIENIEQVRYEGYGDFGNFLFGGATGLIGGAIVGHIGSYLANGRENLDFTNNINDYKGIMIGAFAGAVAGAYIGGIPKNDETFHLAGMTSEQKASLLISKAGVDIRW